LLLAAGAGQTPRDDPFFGRTRIPPPATGCAAGRLLILLPDAAGGAGALGGAGRFRGAFCSAGHSAATPPSTQPSASPPSNRYQPSPAAAPPPRHPGRVHVAAGNRAKPLGAAAVVHRAGRSSAAPGSVRLLHQLGGQPCRVAWRRMELSRAIGRHQRQRPRRSGLDPRAASPGSVPVTVSRIGGSSADRNPRPVDDAGGGASLAERRPAAGPLPARNQRRPRRRCSRTSPTCRSRVSAWMRDAPAILDRVGCRATHRDPRQSVRCTHPTVRSTTC